MGRSKFIRRGNEESSGFSEYRLVECCAGVAVLCEASQGHQRYKGVRFLSEIRMATQVRVTCKASLPWYFDGTELVVAEFNTGKVKTYPIGSS